MPTSSSSLLWQATVSCGYAGLRALHGEEAVSYTERVDTVRGCPATRESNIPWCLIERLLHQVNPVLRKLRREEVDGTRPKVVHTPSRAKHGSDGPRGRVSVHRMAGHVAARHLGSKRREPNDAQRMHLITGWDDWQLNDLHTKIKRTHSTPWLCHCHSRDLS